MALDFAAGCIGGAAGILVGYPFDTVKVRIQTQDISKGRQYTGTFQCLSKIVKTEGTSALYRGLSSPLAGVALINAIGFGVYGNVLRRLPDPDSIASVTLAGTVAGFLQAFVCSPMELVKTQMQVHEGKGPIDVIKEIVHKNGIRGLTKGMGLTIMREVPGCAIYFGSYEMLVRGHEDNTAVVFTAGGIGGILSWIFTYPQDVIKSRIQGDVIGPGAKYKGYTHCFRESMKREGPQMLVRGIGSTIVRAFPVNATTMGVATLVLRTFSDEDIKVYDTMARVQKGSHLHFELPTSVEKYFEQKQMQRYQYLPNIATIATDGPSIVQIGHSGMAVSHQRLYVENALVALPSKYYDKDKDPKEVELGTTRAGVSLSTLVRVLERLIKRRKRDEEKLQELSNREFAHAGEYHCHDFIMDRDSMMVLAQPACQKAAKKFESSQEDGIPAPSLLVTRERGQNVLKNDSITTSDFLIPSTLHSRTDDKDKIYGFYYLVC